MTERKTEPSPQTAKPKPAEETKAAEHPHQTDQIGHKDTGHEKAGKKDGR